VEVGVQLGIARFDGVDVRAGQLVAGDLAALEEPGRVLRGQSQGVDHSQVPLGRRWGHPEPPPALDASAENLPRGARIVTKA
jgi:hypothetical protein